VHAPHIHASVCRESRNPLSRNVIPTFDLQFGDRR
jgi:hypothetical protein